MADYTPTRDIFGDFISGLKMGQSIKKQEAEAAQQALENKWKADTAAMQKETHALQKAESGAKFTQMAGMPFSGEEFNLGLLEAASRRAAPEVLGAGPAPAAGAIQPVQPVDLSALGIKAQPPTAPLSDLSSLRPSYTAPAPEPVSPEVAGIRAVPAKAPVNIPAIPGAAYGVQPGMTPIDVEAAKRGEETLGKTRPMGFPEVERAQALENIAAGKAKPAKDTLAEKEASAKRLIEARGAEARKTAELRSTVQAEMKKSKNDLAAQIRGVWGPKEIRAEAIRRETTGKTQAIRAGMSGMGAVLEGEIAHERVKYLEEKGLTVQASAAKQDAYKADALSLNNMTKSADMSVAFQQKAIEQGKLAAQRVAELGASKYQDWNSFSQWVEKHTGDAEAMSKLETDLIAFSREYNRITSGSANMTGQIHQEAQKKVEQILTRELPPNRLLAVIGEANRDIELSIKAYNDQVEKIRQRMRGVEESAAAGGEQLKPGEKIRRNTKTGERAVFDAQGKLVRKL